MTGSKLFPTTNVALLDLPAGEKKIRVVNRVEKIAEEPNLFLNAQLNVKSYSAFRILFEQKKGFVCVN